MITGDGLLAHHRLRSGAGVPLVLLHGFPLDSRMWLDVVDLLPGEPDVIALDLPGMGESPTGPDVAATLGAPDEPSIVILSVIAGSIEFSRIVTGTPPLAKVMTATCQVPGVNSVAGSSVGAGWVRRSRQASHAARSPNTMGSSPKYGSAAGGSSVAPRSAPPTETAKMAVKPRY